MECPKNASGWRQREDARRCPGDTFYHCLRDEVGTARESCLEKTWVQPGFCPEFNSVAKKMDVSLCQESRGKCPTRTYWSNDVYMYSACLPTTLITIPGNGLTGAATQSKTSITASSVPNINGAEENGSSVTAIVVPIIILFLVAILVCGAVLFWRRRRKRENNDEPDNPKSSTLLDDLPYATDKGKLSTEQETKKLIEGDHSKDAEKSGKEILIPAAVETSDGKKISKDGKFEYSERFESLGKIVERAGPLLSENGILILVAQSKKTMAEVAQAVALTCDTQEYPEGFQEFNDSFARMDESSKTTKCVVFNDCFQKGGINIKIYEHKSIFNDLYEKQLPSGGRLRFVISIPMTLWNARRVTLSSLELFNEKYVLKFNDL